MKAPQDDQVVHEIRRREAMEDRARDAELLLLKVALRLGLPAAGTTYDQTARLVEGWLKEGHQ